MSESASEILVMPIVRATIASLMCGAVYLGVLRMMSTVATQILGRVRRHAEGVQGNCIAREARQRRTIRLRPGA